MVISKAVKSYKQLAHVRYRKSEIDDFCRSVTSIFDNKQVHSGEYKQFIIKWRDFTSRYILMKFWMANGKPIHRTAIASSKSLNSDRNTANSFDPAKNE